MESKHSFICVLICSILMICSAAHIQAEPSEEKLRPFRKQLSKKINYHFMEIPLERALRYIQKKSDLPMSIDYENCSFKLKQTVTFKAEDMTVREVMYWLCFLCGIDYDVRNNTLFISTSEEIIKPYIEFKIYDVRSLVNTPPDMPGPNIGLGSGGHINYMRSQSKETGSSIDAAIIADIIAYSIPEGHWHAKGIGIDIKNGLLAVNNTRDVHIKIEKLLRNLRSNYTSMISFNARIFSVPKNTLRTFLDGLPENGSRTILNHEQVIQARELFARKGTAVATTRTTCYNDQRTHLIAANQEAYVRDITPVVAELSGGADPEMDSITEGFVFDVRPTAGFDKTNVTLELRVTAVSNKDNIEKVYIPLAGGSVLKQGNTESGQTEEDTSNLSVPIQLPETDHIRFRTLARIPDKGGILLSGQSDTITRLSEKDRELVLLVQATLVK